MPRRTNANDNYVLDTYALQAFLASEPGADTVEDLLRAAGNDRTTLFVSWVSMSEIYYVTHRKSVAENPEVKARVTVEGLQRLALTILPVREAEALKAGRIKAKFTLSLADAFVAALGQIQNAKIVTGDPEFRPLEEAGEIRVVWLPGKSRK